MSITLQETLLGLAGGAILLALTIFWWYLKARSAHPIRCVHCWVYEKKETVVGYDDVPGQWAICSRCVRHYWHFSDE